MVLLGKYMKILIQPFPELAGLSWDLRGGGTDLIILVSGKDRKLGQCTIAVKGMRKGIDHPICLPVVAQLPNNNILWTSPASSTQNLDDEC